jgi:hypothetical protein
MRVRLALYGVALRVCFAPILWPRTLPKLIPSTTR